VNQTAKKAVVHVMKVKGKPRYYVILKNGRWKFVKAPKGKKK